MLQVAASPVRPQRRPPPRVNWCFRKQPMSPGLHRADSRPQVLLHSGEQLSPAPLRFSQGLAASSRNTRAWPQSSGGLTTAKQPSPRLFIQGQQHPRDSSDPPLVTLCFSPYSVPKSARCAPPGPVPERLCLPGSVLPSPCGRPYTGEDTARSSSSGPCRLGRTGEFGAGACTLLIPVLPEPQEPGEGVKAHPVPRQVT